jgi:hypothetical protein
MRVVSPFTKQHTETAFRTNLSMMSSKVADEATTRTEEEIGIFVG